MRSIVRVYSTPPRQKTPSGVFFHTPPAEDSSSRKAVYEKSSESVCRGGVDGTSNGERTACEPQGEYKRERHLPNALPFVRYKRHRLRRARHHARRCMKSQAKAFVVVGSTARVMVSEPLASRKASISVSDICRTRSRLFVTKDTACGGLAITQGGV